MSTTPPTTPPTAKCTAFRKSTGAPCPNPVPEGVLFCAQHAPELAAARKANAVGALRARHERAGRVRLRLAPPLDAQEKLAVAGMYGPPRQDLPAQYGLSSTEDQLRWLELVAAEVRDTKMDPDRRAQCVTRIVAVAAELLKSGGLEKQVADLKAAIAEINPQLGRKLSVLK